MTARLNCVCTECGSEFDCTGVGNARDFCCQGCRQRWNNRRLQRGAALYDLYMAHRFDRGEAQRLGVFQAINRLASDFRLEDRDQRSGRRSWRRADAILAERPHLRAARFHVRAGR